jgi:hypothetical protein
MEMNFSELIFDISAKAVSSLAPLFAGRGLG